MKEYSTSEFAKAIGVTRRTLINWEKSGKLKPYSKNKNGYKIYSQNQLDQFLQNKPETKFVLKQDFHDQKEKKFEILKQKIYELQELLDKKDKFCLEQNETIHNQDKKIELLNTNILTYQEKLKFIEQENENLKNKMTEKEDKNNYIKSITYWLFRMRKTILIAFFIIMLMFSLRFGVNWHISKKNMELKENLKYFTNLQEIVCVATEDNGELKENEIFVIKDTGLLGLYAGFVEIYSFTEQKEKKVHSSDIKSSCKRFISNYIFENNKNE